MTSNCWIVVILIGAALVTLGNIQYNRSKESESKRGMAEQAMMLLRPELKRNLEILPEQQKMAQENSYHLSPPFETEAWLTVSKSNLLIGLRNEVLSKLIQAYYEMNKANSLHSRINENLIEREDIIQQAYAQKSLKSLNNDFRIALRDTKLVLETLLNPKE